MKLSGKCALITGGSRGIGLAIAQEFVAEGARVGLVSRSLEKLKSAQESLGENCFIFQADITKISDLERAVDHFSSQMGNFDIVVANAGISLETPLTTTSEGDFDRLISANLKGVFFSVQKALPHMNEGGSIILISSLAGKQGVKNFSIYAASKAGVDSLAKSLAAELCQKKIRVNSISPGVVKTSILDAAGLTEEDLQTWTRAIPMKRLAMPNEIAKAALFLASPESAYITATDLLIDGGVSGISPL